MVCRSEGRTRLFEVQVQKIAEWMEAHHTHPLLRRLLAQYLCGRGAKIFDHLKYLHPEAQALAQAQDRIGWRNFTEGKLSLKTCSIQNDFLRTQYTRLTVDS